MQLAKQTAGGGGASIPPPPLHRRTSGDSGLENRLSAALSAVNITAPFLLQARCSPCLVPRPAHARAADATAARETHQSPLLLTLRLRAITQVWQPGAGEELILSPELYVLNAPWLEAKADLDCLRRASLLASPLPVDAPAGLPALTYCERVRQRCLGRRARCVPAARFLKGACLFRSQTSRAALVVGAEQRTRALSPRDWQVTVFTADLVHAATEDPRRIAPAFAGIGAPVPQAE